MCGGLRDEPRTLTLQNDNPDTDETAAGTQHLAESLIQYAEDEIEAEEGED